MVLLEPGLGAGQLFPLGRRGIVQCDLGLCAADAGYGVTNASTLNRQMEHFAWLTCHLFRALFSEISDLVSHCSRIHSPHAR